MTPLKRYYLQHAESRALRLVDAPDFHSACHAVGWFPADTVLLGVLPIDAPEPVFTVQVVHTLHSGDLDALLSDSHAKNEPSAPAE